MLKVELRNTCSFQALDIGKIMLVCFSFFSVHTMKKNYLIGSLVYLKKTLRFLEKYGTARLFS